MMVGLPKIPDSAEIAEMISCAMQPMMADIKAIRVALEEQNKMLMGRENGNQAAK
jgi:hypothetical protein